MSVSRKMLLLCPRLNQLTVKRSMSGLKNWKRLSMDELGVPTEPWSQYYARTNGRYTMHLVLGASFLVGTVTYAFMCGAIKFRPTPYHLLQKGE